MTQKEIFNIFYRSGALQTGHFKLTSGLHSDQYFQCALVLQHPRYAEQLCSIAKEYFGGEQPETVIAPAVGGIVVGQEIARILGCRSIFAERKDGQMTLRRGFSLRKGERVLVCEDVVTTGGSVKEVIELAQQAGAHVIGVFAVVDRSGGGANFGVPFLAAMQMQVKTYPPESCPLCAQDLPIDQPGSRQL